ncbi:MAG: thioredoxin family protein [Thiovulaceae bacterium]|nr:thioredoxin family protein [Sulfurimonadaceae bacterium]
MVAKWKILIIVILFGTFNPLNASHVRWYFDFEKAHQEALKQNKCLMVLLLQKDCPACKEVLATTFMNQPYINAINKKFISVVIIKDQTSSYPIEMLYTVTYPTLFFLDNSELFCCKTLEGNITPQRFKNHLKLCK